MPSIAGGGQLTVGVELVEGVLADGLEQPVTHHCRIEVVGLHQRLHDQRRSPALLTPLRDAGHDAVHVADIGLLTASDDLIPSTAADEHYTVITAHHPEPAHNCVGRVRYGPGLVPKRSRS